MNKLDPHALFSLFEQGDEEVYREHGVESALKNPYVILNMVSRAVENYNLMDMLYTKNHGEAYKKVRLEVQYKYFNKIYLYLERLDVVNIKDVRYRIGESYDLESIVLGLDVLRAYFEELEKYEKCAVIKKAIDFTYEVAYKQKYSRKQLL
jgi:hypothetical protein